ncbi:MAU2 chromatid cohesion factor homolog isoform X2 [Nasonia vitripennis]|uniref:MAU2 chromatid cohesion factor homolog n=1 Tax=Nasonia vitripennis TaxID=7425 RepID=A0A7M7IP18_NASVI|nr:MAU2 chromatid cohesion factor homolog isoform X2 [Nasonia vitripennis]
MASSQDAWYLSLLGLAENFRTSNPPSIKSCIQCLQAVFNFKPPPRVEARTHLQLGNILLTHTKNIDLARTHLERAWQLSQTINQFDDVKFEAASILAELYEQQQQSSLSQSILRKAIELSQHNVYWHCRLIFQLAQIHASEKDLNAAGGLLAVGADYSQISNANYTKVLFLLSRCMLLLIDKKFAEAAPLLFSTGQQVENWQGNPHQKEYLKVYFLVLQVCHNVMSGQSVKPCLKQLQQSIQTIMAPAWPSDEIVTGPHIGDMFIWMPKEHLFVLVYLVTVMHSMQSGYMDKAQKYTDKALAQIENLKLVENKPILSVFQLMLLEHIVMCRLVMGNKSAALSEISQACQLCRQQPKLLQSHRAQLHVLLGLYAMSMNCMQEAEAQLLSALNKSQENELVTFANLNLAIVYLRTRRDNHLGPLLERIKPETLPSLSHSLRAAAYYVQGLQAFFGARYNEAKRHLRETLKMANAEDLNRLTSCSLVLLGHIFLSLGNNKESMNMVTPAMQLASKIPDVHVQLWATAILKDLNRICNDRVRENEAYQMHCTFSQTLLKDHFQSTQMSEHSLIQWTEGPIPMLPNNSPASTSQAIL